MPARRSLIAAVALLIPVVGGAAVSAAGVRWTRQADGTLLVTGHGNGSSVRARSARPPSEGVSILVDRHAERSGLESRLVHAVIRVESDYDPRALSVDGAMGLMQLMPETARALGVEDPWDPEQNLRGGTTYLARLLRQFEGRLDLALAGYNAGPEAVARYDGVPPYPETRSYVETVLRLVGGESEVGRWGGPLRGRTVFLSRSPSAGLMVTTTPPATNASTSTARP